MKLYQESEPKDQELIDKLLVLYPSFKYDKIILFIEAFKKNDNQIQAELLKLCESEEQEFILDTLCQMPTIPNELFLNLLVGVRKIGSEDFNVEDYIKSEYDKKRQIQKIERQNYYLKQKSYKIKREYSRAIS